MKTKQFAVLTKSGRIIEICPTLPLAKGKAYQAALDNTGDSYYVSIWDGETMTRTKHEYKAAHYSKVASNLVNVFDDFLR